jgi:hypothetical protein
MALNPKRCNQIKIMPFIQPSLAPSKSASPKATTLHAQYVAVSCCLSAELMATRKKGKAPTKQGQRVDHAAKLVSEEGGDGEGAGLEVSSLLSYTLG